jgi:hypothetical protein
VAKCAEASAIPNSKAMAALVSALAVAADSFLDPAARAELDALASRLDQAGS